MDQARLECMYIYQSQTYSDLDDRLADKIIQDKVNASSLGSRMVLLSSDISSDQFIKHLF